MLARDPRVRWTTTISRLAPLVRTVHIINWGDGNGVDRRFHNQIY